MPEPSWDALARWGYPSADRIWDGAYWGLLSSTLVHLAMWHLAFNVYWLWTLGSAVERVLGWRKYSALLLAAAIVSSGVQLGVSGATGHGASGVVYALFGLMWASRRRVPAFAATLGERTVLLFLLWLVGCFVASQVGEVAIGNAAHASGLIFGVLVAQWDPSQRYRRGIQWATAAVVLVSLVPLFWNPWSGTWVSHRAYKAHVAGRYDEAIAGYRRSMELGADRVWGLQSLALAYLSKGSNQEYAAILTELRTVSQDAAAALEQEVREANRNGSGAAEAGASSSPDK